MHKLLLIGEVSVLTIVGLVIFGLVMTSIRALIEGHFDIESPFMPGDEVIAEQRASTESWLHRSLVAFDQFCNVVFFRGYPDETISAHCWRASLKNHLWGQALNRWLEWVQPDHGFLAASGDHYRAITIASIEKQALGMK